MKATGQLWFALKTGWIQTGFDQLASMGSYQRVDSKTTQWIFPMERIRDVEAILGIPIEFAPEGDYLTMRSRMPSERDEAHVCNPHGIDNVRIEEKETIYVLIEHRKIEDEATLEERVITRKHEIPKVLVEIAKHVVKELQENRFKNQKIPSKVVAERIVRHLQIERFNRQDSGTFDWQKFLGNRKDYCKYYYYPLKVLAYKQCIVHHKNGKVSKLPAMALPYINQTKIEITEKELPEYTVDESDDDDDEIPRDWSGGGT